MKLFKPVLTVFAAGVWINFSEFVRNEILVKSYWLNHYQGMNLAFPSSAVNAAVWVLWGFVFAVVILMLSYRFTIWQTTLIAWFSAFFMMWLVLWNLAVLPAGILLYAVPLSLVETLVAALICIKLSGVNKRAVYQRGVKNT